MIWQEPDAGRHDAATARVLRRWNKEMLAVEDREHCNRTLGLTQQRVCLDFFTNTILVYIDTDEEALIWDIHANQKAWSDDRVSNIARSRMADLATLWSELSTKFNRRAVDTAFMTWLRGPTHDNYDSDAEAPEELRDRWLQAMNEFALGAVINLVFRPPVYSAYLPHDRFDKLLVHLRDWAQALHEGMGPSSARTPHAESPMGLTHNPTSPPAPAPGAAPTSAPDEGPARKHDKGPRAARWAGPRPRAGGLSTDPGGAEAPRPRDEGKKMASIEAGKARGRQLRAAEQARIAELWERQRIVSLGFAIGQGAD